MAGLVHFFVTLVLVGLSSASEFGPVAQRPQLSEIDEAENRYFCNATVVDFESPQGTAVIRSDALIIINGRKISAVLTGTSARIKEAEIQCVNLDSRVVIPGLIDAHVHITFQKELPVDCQSIQSSLDYYLAAGVTTVADLGATDHGQSCIDSAHRGDAILSTGRKLSAKSPLCNYAGLFIDCPTSEHEAELAVDKRTAAGRDIVKLYSISTRGDNIRAALITRAASEGIATIEHEISCWKVWENLDSGKPMPNTLAHPPLTQWSNMCKQSYGDKLLNALKKRDVGIISTVQIPVSGGKPMPRPAIEFLQLALNHGVVVGLGTDIDAPLSSGSVPLHNEMTLLENASGDWEFPLRAATIGSAYVLGQAQRIGNLRSGKQADFLVLDVNDYGADSDRLNKICMVVKAGNIVHQFISCQSLTAGQ